MAETLIGGGGRESERLVGGHGRDEKSWRSRAGVYNRVRATVMRWKLRRALAEVLENVRWSTERANWRGLKW
jgi:hypothetical protein